MVGLWLFAHLIITTLTWGPPVEHTVGTGAAVPALGIVLGPCGHLGQSIMAASLMGACGSSH